MESRLIELKDCLEESLGFFSYFRKDGIKNDFETISTHIGEAWNTIIAKEHVYTLKISSLESEILEHVKNFEGTVSRHKVTVEDLQKELSDLKIKQKLISSLLSAESNNIGLDTFREILYGEFLDFANSESALANEAEMILKLQEIEKELEVISASSVLYSKNVIAIGGGFSSGKSEFISSFIQGDIKLPIGLVPTTAIPTYVFNNGTESILGCNHKGGVVDFKSIDEELHKKLSHDFIKSFDFNLKDILPFMLMGIKMDYEDICFVDTPGYNPADVSDGYTNVDLKTAKDFLENANSFIWLIGADANGTISASDLEFLSHLDLEDKKVYIIYNKADLKPLDDLEDVLSEIEESLDDYDIDIEGISAYSSILKKEYSYLGISLKDFLEENNTKTKKHAEMIKKLDFVASEYRNANLSIIDEKENVSKELHSLSLDILEDGVETSSNAFERILSLKKLFSVEKEEQHIELLNICMEKMRTSIDINFNIKEENAN